MKTYLVFKNKIEGLEDVGETIALTEKVAASSIHNLKEQVSLLENYQQTLEKVLIRLSAFYKGNYLKSTGSKKALVLLFGDKSLVGSLWHNMVDYAIRQRGLYDNFIIIGTKGDEYLSSEGIRADKSFPAFSNAPTPEEVKSLTDYLFSQYKNIFSRIDILYPRFFSLVSQQPIVVKLLPFTFTLGDQAAEGLPIFSSSKKAMFFELMEKYVSLFLYKIVLEAKLSELGARTVASEHAQKKVKGLIFSMRSDFLKERKKVVTLKQLESFLSHKKI